MPDKMSADQKRIKKQLIHWQKCPWDFAYEALGVKELDPVQIEILKAWADRSCERIAVKASTGTGKTFIDAIMVWHFISLFGEAGTVTKGLLTSIDGSNMEAGLWAEMARLYNGSEFLKRFFVFQDDKVFSKAYPKTWFVERRTWDQKAESALHQDALGLAGHHAKYSLFMIDESGGVPKSVVVAGERTLVNVNDGGFRKLVQTGNPTHRSGPLWDAFNDERRMWRTFTMTGDPDDANHSKWIDEKWARDLIQAYGRDYPYVQVYVLGEFPDQDFNAFVSESDVEAAMNRVYEPAVYFGMAGRMGIDVSYGGDDQTWMFPRRGLQAFEPEEVKVPLGSTMLGLLMSQIIVPKFRLLQLEEMFFDATGGYAYAVMEAVKQQNLNPIGLKFNAKSSDPRFANLRTQMYWNAAEWIKKGGALPRVHGLKEELCATSYTMQKDKMIAEPKDMVKKKLKGKSPNIADSLVCTFAYPDNPSRNQDLFDRFGNPMNQGTTKMQSVMDMNPLEDFSYSRQNKPGNGVVQGWGGMGQWK